MQAPRYAALGTVLLLGTVVLIAAFSEFLVLARRERGLEGEEFQRASTALTAIVVAELIAVAVFAWITVRLSRRTGARLLVLAVVVWGLALFDLVVLALGGAVPR